MKRFLCLLLTCLLALSAACAEPLGFGFVNATDVALRKEPGGKRVHRLAKDTCVWIAESRTARDGTLWYRINAGVHENHANYDFSGWMMASFIDAGDELWHDIAAVSANRLGMIALRTDGTVETAGRPIVNSEGTAWVSVRGWADGYRNVRQVSVLPYLSYCLITEDGRYVAANGLPTPALASVSLRLVADGGGALAITQDQRLICEDSRSSPRWLYPQNEPARDDLAHVVQIVQNHAFFLLRTDDGRVFAACTEPASMPASLPDWESWTDLVSVSTSDCGPNGANTPGGCTYYAGVRRDGSVLAAPQALADVVAAWTDMADVQLAPTYVLGLRQDGTAVSAGLFGHSAPDVSAWRGITAVAVADDYCVGITETGGLVFAGEHIFMREGHS